MSIGAFLPLYFEVEKQRKNRIEEEEEQDTKRRKRDRERRELDNSEGSWFGLEDAERYGH